MELVRGRRLQLGRDYPADRRYGDHAQIWLGSPCEEIRPLDGSRFQVFLDAVNAVQQAVPAPVRSTNRGTVGQNPAGNEIRGFRSTVLWSNLHPDQSMEQILSLPRPEPKSPGANRGQAAGRRHIYG